MNAPAYRIGQRPVSSDAFYAAACDPRRSVAVEACAGAGKTWMLVSRVLLALLAGIEPQHILAITFTRKASGEMRERLDGWLRQFSDANSTHAERVQGLRQRGLAAADAERQAPALGRLHEHLLRAGRSVEMCTFHAWFGQLLANAPLALLDQMGLPAAFEPIEDTAVLHDDLLRRFHRAVQADAALRADYVALLARHGRSVLLDWLKAAWQRAPELARADAAGMAAGAVPNAAMVWPRCEGLDDPASLLHNGTLGDDIAALARQLGAAGKSKAQTAANLLRTALDSADTNAAFEHAWSALFTDKDEPRKQLGDSPLQLGVVEGLLELREMRLQQQAHLDHAAMLRLSRVLLAEYAQLKRQRGLVDMADLERVAEALLGNSELAGWVQERLDQRVRQVLIDEFQDTSPLQWQVLRSWLSAYAGAGGGASGQRPPAVFIVGDPKQSIYRFRGAEPQVFAAARDFVLQGLEGELLQCDHTQRNAPAIVAALNEVFEDAARTDGWGPYRAHTTSSVATGGVARLPGVARPPRKAKTAAAAAAAVWRDSLTQPREEPELRLRAAEAAQAAAAVAGLIAQHGLQPAEIMVLARKRASLALVADALAALGLPHVVAEPLALHESPEALDLVAVLDVLASPGHDLSLARALKSPIFGASDDDLLWLAQAVRAPGAPPCWLATLLQAQTETLPSAALVRAQGLLRDWTAVAALLPTHDLLDRIVHQASVVARVAAVVPAARRAGALHAVGALLAASLSQQGGRFASVYGFVRELRAGRVGAPGIAPSAAVQLLTVHGAKGLEARAVVVVDADPEPRPVVRATVLIDWPVESAAPRRVAFLRSASAVPRSLATLWAREVAAAEREELNGLYVAMTRAREWLVFNRTGPSRPSAGRAWWARIEGVAQPWDLAAPPATQPAVGATARVPVLPPFLARGARGALPTQAARSAPGNAAAARLGQAVHRVLEWAGRPGALLAEADLPAACAAAARAFDLPAAAVPRVQHIAGQVLASPACARFFGGSALQWAGSEVPVEQGGELLRIDRLVALADGARTTWWVLDYKLQSAPDAVPAYREQMRRYVTAVQALQPADEVRGAFITGGGAVVEI